MLSHPQLVPGSGEGQNTRNTSIVGAEADRQSTAKVAGSRRHSVSRALFAQGCSCPLKRRRLVLVPVWLQLDVRLIRLPLSQELFLVEWLLVLQHEIDRPTQLMGKDGQCLTLAVLTGLPLEPCLRRLIISQEEYCCL